MKKKGQLTIFILAGLVILVITSMVYLMGSSLFQSEVPREIRPVASYAESCLKQASEKGIFLLEMQGGYIKLPEKLEQKKAFLDIGFKVPYWYYNGISRKPSLSMMESQLGSYVNESFKDCIADFSALDDSFIVSYLSSPNVTVQIYDDSVSVRLNWRIAVKPKGTTELLYLDGFSTELDSALGRLYSLASEIMELENKRQFLEYYTDEMIASSDWLPYEGMFIDCKPQRWQLSEMKSYTKNLISYNLPYIYFKGTDYKKSGIPYYDNLYGIKLPSSFKGLKVELMYNKDWQLDFDVKPRNGNFVEPITYESSGLGLCYKIFHHKYSLRYPVLFRIDDSSKEIMQRESFYFSTPVVVKDNMPARHGSLFQIHDIDKLNRQEYCSLSSDVMLTEVDESGRIIATPAKQKKRKNSLKVYAVDSIKGIPDGVLPNVSISYQCISFRCPIGKTSYPKENGLITGQLPSLEADFPDCINGKLIAEAPGYWRGIKTITISPETDKSQAIVELYPLKSLNFVVKAVDSGSIRSLENDELALVNIENPMLGYDSSFVYPSSDENNFSIPVSDQSYKVDIKLTKSGQIIGGAELNWTPGALNIYNNNVVVFYAVKADIDYMDAFFEEEAMKSYEKAINESKRHKPIFLY